MKYIVFRVYKSIFPLAIFAGMIVVTVSYSIKLYREGYIPNQRWSRYSIENYDGPYSVPLDEQIRNMEKQYADSADSDALQSLNAMKFLKSRNIPYSQVAEGGFFVGDSKTKPYFDYKMSQRVYLFNVVAVVLIIGMVCINGRANGAFAFDMLIWGRKRIYRNELACCFVMITGLCVLEMLLIWACRSSFDNYAKYYLYYRNGKFFLMSTTAESLLTYFSYYLRLLAMSAVYYSIARLIVYSLPYYAFSGAAAYLLVFMHQNKYDTTLQFVHNENIGTFYKLWDRYIQFWALKIGIAIAVAALMTVTYKIYMKRNMRTEY